jgi:2-keto-3-deoxy-L-fuconate dehydrogenase
MFSLNNKIVIVTGGGSGIGRAISILFAKQGATVHILEFNETSGQDTVNQILANEGKAQSHGCDVSNQAKVKEVFEWKILQNQILREFSM